MFHTGLVHYISNHFEIFFYVGIAAGILFLALYFALSVSLLFDRHVFLRFIFSVAMFLIVGGEIMLMGYVYWLNYRSPKEAMSFPQNVADNTRWVKDDLRVTYIEGHQLKSVRINGGEMRGLYDAHDPVKEYYFSPDGSKTLIVTLKDLVLLEKNTGRAEMIDTLNSPELQGIDVKGSINSVSWSPDSRKFCYGISRWSNISGQDHFYIYDLSSRKKSLVKSPTRSLSSAYWDRKGENLYYLDYNATTSELSDVSFDVNIFRIPVGILTPELVSTVPIRELSMPSEHLSLRDIELFVEGDLLSFGGKNALKRYSMQGGTAIGIDKEDYLYVHPLAGFQEKFLKLPASWLDKSGSMVFGPHSKNSTWLVHGHPGVGIDDEGYLYFIKSKWFRKRLFKIPRAHQGSEHQFQYRGGELVVTSMQWTPSLKYVILEHQELGTLVLDPVSGKAGVLLGPKAEAVGWYTKLTAE